MYVMYSKFKLVKIVLKFFDLNNVCLLIFGFFIENGLKQV